MKRLALLLALAVGACSPQAKVVEKQIIDAAVLACVLAAPLEASFPEVMAACGVLEQDAPIVEKMLAGRKVGAGIKAATK